MWNLYKAEPDTLYHYTKRQNVDSIKKDRQLKKFKDTYVFACKSYDECISVINNTILNPNARFIDFNGISRTYSKIELSDYVILKIKPRYSKISNWYISDSTFGKSDLKNDINNSTLAYKGNLPVDVMEVIDIEISKETTDD